MTPRKLERIEALDRVEELVHLMAISAVPNLCYAVDDGDEAACLLKMTDQTIAWLKARAAVPAVAISPHLYTCGAVICLSVRIHSCLTETYLNVMDNRERSLLERLGRQTKLKFYLVDSRGVYRGAVQRDWSSADQGHTWAALGTALAHDHSLDRMDYPAARSAYLMDHAGGHESYGAA